jgi:hypothetical protein
MSTDAERSGPFWPRAAAATVLVLVGGGAALLVAAMALYPGGNWADHAARGHTFFRNFFCDLLADVAGNGEPNPGAGFATAGMLLVFAALVPFWMLVPRLIPGRARLGNAVRVLGIASAVVLPAVPLAPSGRCGQLHAASIFVGGAPALVAAALAAYALLTARATRWPHGVLAAAVLVVAAVDGVIYGQLVAAGDPVPPWTLPVLQKLGAALLLGWMMATGVAAARRTPRRA